VNRRTTIIAIPLAAALTSLLFFQGCSSAPQVWPDKPGKRILTTFAPLYCFAKTIAGDDANVMCLLPATDPHGAEWSPQDVLKVRGADLVVANGFGIDDRVVRGLVDNASKKVPMLELGEVLEEKYHDLLDVDEHEHKKGEKEDHHHHDPHLWLGPKQASAMVETIALRLIEMDPPNKDKFRARADAFKVKLDELTKYGHEKFKDKKNKKIVTQHDAMVYFAHEFGLDIVGYIRFSDNTDATPQELIKVCKEKHPAAFTFEAAFKKEQVETVRDSLTKQGITTALAEVDPIERFPNGEPDADYYLRRMYLNIDNLAQALK
jgi:ABC-type Zn uptake system ZnuABC Zn-binding protein ZnuA